MAGVGVYGSPFLASHHFANLIRGHSMSYMAQRPDINAVHTLILLSLYDWGKSNGCQAWAYTEMATRMAQGIYSRMKANTKDVSGVNSSTQQEMITRSVWTCFALDCMLRCGRYGPQSAQVEVLDIPLPMSEDDFNIGIESTLRPTFLARYEMETPSLLTDNDGQRHGSQ